jgi:hypothetical protein
MEPIAIVGVVFLALTIGWVGLVLAATWYQITEERRRLEERRR